MEICDVMKSENVVVGTREADQRMECLPDCLSRRVRIDARSVSKLNYIAINKFIQASDGYAQ